MYNQTQILTNLKKQRRLLEKELSRINKAIFALEPLPAQFMEWKQKALQFIADFKCYSQTSEILNFVFKDSPEILEDIIIRKRYTTALSVALNDLYKAKMINKFRLYRVRGDFYGLPEWFAQDGVLNKKYYSRKLIALNTNVNLLLMK